MKHIRPIHIGSINKQEQDSHKGCGECQSSCQSACKTSCTVANQVCRHDE